MANVTMMSPGVYLNEIDYSQYVVDSSTCIIGMVGGARFGPIGIPTLITSQQELVKTFGEPVEGEYGLYSALMALTNANQIFYTRVVRGGTKASAGVVGTDKITYKAVDIGEASNGLQIEQTAVVGGKFTVTVKAKKPGSEEKEKFENLTLTPSEENYVEAVINSKSKLIRADVQATGTVEAKTFELGKEEGTQGTETGSKAHAGKKGQDKILLTSKYFDSKINGCSAIFSAIDSYKFFDVTVVDESGQLIERWHSLSLDLKSDRFVEKIINNGSNRIECSVDLTDSVVYKEDTLIFSGGDDGIVGISASDIIGETSGGGLYSFSNPETVTIDVLTASGWSDMSVVRAGLEICERRGDCIFIVDPPKGMSVQEMINWSNGTGSYTSQRGLDTSFGALYWPWVEINDSFTSKNMFLPPSGFVAGQYAYNDEVGHPWNSPAGLQRGRLTKAINVEMSPTQGERDALYGNRNVVNCIVNFISNGIVIWGNKTLQRTPTALDRVNVRRLMCYLERSIARVTRGFVFEQNFDSTWERWRCAAEPILQNAKVNGGIYEYQIKTVATAQDYENNRMPIEVAVKPIKAAEFISLTFKIMGYSASFDK